MNAGLADLSTGSAPTQTWGLRGRLEWDKAAKWGKLAMSPYGEFSYMNTHMNADTESGGGFPAQFNKRNDHATEIRFGANAEYPVGGSTKLIALAEGVHRFEKEGSHSTGTVTGLSGFDLAGPTHTQTWGRFGAGVETGLAGGTLSLMANTTTRGSAPTLWLSLSWGVEF